MQVSLYNLLSLVIPFSIDKNEIRRHDVNEIRIWRNITSGYDIDQAPENAKILPFISFDQIHSLDEKQQVVSANGGFIFMWKDERLQWNPEDFGGIQELGKPHFLNLKKTIWIPLIYASELWTTTFCLTGGDQFDFRLSSGGSVQIRMTTVLKTTCVFSYQDYPNDRQNCSFYIFAPYSADVLQFMRYGGAEVQGQKWPLRVNVGDFNMNRIEGTSLFLLLGNTVIKNPKTTELRYCRSIFRITLLFNRRYAYYTMTMAMPLFCLSAATNFFALLRGTDGITWLLGSLACQGMNMILMSSLLPPDYNEIPVVAQIGLFVMVETGLLIIWRMYTLLYYQRKADAVSSAKNAEELEVHNMTPTTDTLSLVDNILGLCLIVHTIINGIILLF